MFSAAIERAAEQPVHSTAATGDLPAAREYTARAACSGAARDAVTSPAAEYSGHAAYGAEPVTAREPRDHEPRDHVEPIASAAAAGDNVP